MSKFYQNLKNFILIEDRLNTSLFSKKSIITLIRSILEPLAGENVPSVIFHRLKDTTNLDSIIKRLEYSRNIDMYNFLDPDIVLKDDLIELEFILLTSSRYNAVFMWDYSDDEKKENSYVYMKLNSKNVNHIFEILSNAIDEAREGYGNRILITRFADGSVEVEDHGRGMPVDYNTGEQRYNWELLFCEMYAGGKYTAGEDNYEYSLGLNGLGLCATQYASEWMKADIYRDGFHYHLDFEKGENVGGLQKEPLTRKKTGRGMLALCLSMSNI